MINTYTALVNPYDIYGYCYYADYEPPTADTELSAVPPTYTYQKTPWFNNWA